MGESKRGEWFADGFGFGGFISRLLVIAGEAVGPGIPSLKV